MKTQPLLKAHTQLLHGGKMKWQELLEGHTQPLDEKQTQPLAGLTIAEEAKTPGKTDPGAPRRSIREIIQDLRRAKAEGGQS